MCSQPSGLTTSRGTDGIAVVALHHRIAADADFALLADAAGVAPSVGGDDLDLGLRHGAADGVDADLERVVGVAHGDDGRGFGLAVGDDEFADVHLAQ